MDFNLQNLLLSINNNNLSKPNKAGFIQKELNESELKDLRTSEIAIRKS